MCCDLHDPAAFSEYSPQEYLGSEEISTDHHLVGGGYLRM